MSGLIAAAALLVTLLSLSPDPLGFAPRNSEPPKLVGEIVPSRDWYAWFRFFERNESREVYLDLTFEVQDDLDVSGLLPADRASTRSLRIRACEPPIVDACTEVNIIVLADPEVEEHVFFSGADPDGRMKGHFIVDEYFTQMSLVEITLKPLSISTVENPAVP